MILTDKQTLIRLHDDSLEACALRVRLARQVTGQTQTEAAAAAGIGKTAWNNAEKARNYPTITMMRWLQREHRIDYNFILDGQFAQLPGDVQAAIFAAAEGMNVERATDRKPNTD